MSNKITEANADPEIRNIARRGYKAYIANSDGKSWDGRPCPAWEMLTPAVRGHWCAAVMAACEETASVVAARANADRASLEARVRELEEKIEALRSSMTMTNGGFAQLGDAQLAALSTLDGPEVLRGGVDAKVVPGDGHRYESYVVPHLVGCCQHCAQPESAHAGPQVMSSSENA